MIRIEDSEFAAFSLEQGEIAVPVEIFLPAESDEIRVLVYEQFTEIAEKYAKWYSHEPFCAEAIMFLSNALREPMLRYDMCTSRDPLVDIREYELTRMEDLQRSVILAGTRLLREPDELYDLKNHTTLSLQDVLENDTDVCAIHCEEAGILAIASENDFSDTENGIEMNVECAVGYRNRGYAASCTAVLAQELLSQGKAVIYKCRSSNIASQKIAEKVGFRHVGTRLSCVYYKSYLI